MTATQYRPEVGPEAVGTSLAGDTSSLPRATCGRPNSSPVVDPRVATLEAAVTRFAERVLQDMLTAALPRHWQARAEALEAARPRPEDFHGRATPEALAERWERLTEAAAACREHADLLTRYPDPIAAVVAADVTALMFGGGDDGH